MEKSCIIRPKSELFDGLEKHYGDRDKALSVYGRVHNIDAFNDFLDSKGIPHSVKDMNDGEYMASFIISILDSTEYESDYEQMVASAQRHGLYDNHGNPVMADISAENIEKKIEEAMRFNATGSARGHGHIAVPFTVGEKVGVKVYDQTSLEDAKVDKELEFLAESIKIIKGKLPAGILLQGDTLVEYLLDVTNGFTDYEEVGRVLDDAVGFMLAAKGDMGAKVSSRFVKLMWTSAMESNEHVKAFFLRILGSPMLRQKIIDANGLAEDATEEEILTAFVESVLRTEDSRIQDKYGQATLQTAATKFKKLFKDLDILKTMEEVVDLDRKVDYLMLPELYGKFPNLITYQENERSRVKMIEKTVTDLFNKIYMSIAQREYLSRQARRNLHGNMRDMTKDMIEDQKKISEKAKAFKDSPIEITERNDIFVKKLVSRLKFLENIMQVSIKDIDRCIQSIKEIRFSSENPFRQAEQLKSIFDYVMSYTGNANYGKSVAIGELVPQIEKFILICSEEGVDSKYLEIIREELNELKQRIIDVNNLLKRESVFQETFQPIFRRMLQQIAPDGAILRKNGEVIDVNSDEITEVYSHDISWLSMYINAMFNQPNDMVRMFKNLIDKKNQESRMKEVKFMNKHHEATMRFIKAWKSDKGRRTGRWNMYDFMFQRTYNVYALPLEEFLATDFAKDTFGDNLETAKKVWIKEHEKADNLNFVKAIDEDAYNRAAEAYRDMLIQEDEFKELNNDEERLAWLLDKMIAWEKEHTKLSNGERRPKASEFPSAEYAKMKPYEKEYYDHFMEMKESLDAIRPDAKVLTDGIYLHKNGRERLFHLKEQHSSLWKHLLTQIKESLNMTGYDTKYGEYKNVHVDFLGKEIDRVPLRHGAREFHGNTQMYTRDCYALLAAYADTTYKYNALMDIVSALELGKIHLSKAQVSDMEGVRKKIWKTFFNKEELVTEKTLNLEDTNIGHTINKMLKMSLYMKHKKMGFIGNSNILYDKIASKFMKAISLLYLGGNLTSSIINVITGKTQEWQEALAGEYFNLGDWMKAEKQMVGYMWGMFCDLVRMRPQSVLGLFDQEFNIMDEEDSSYSLRRSNMKLWQEMRIRKFLFAPQHIGDFYMNAQTFFAYMNHQVVMAEDGTEVPLMKVFGKRWNDESDHSLGAELEMRQGVRLNGHDITSRHWIWVRTYYDVVRDADGKPVENRYRTAFRDRRKSKDKNKVYEMEMKKEYVVILNERQWTEDMLPQAVKEEISTGKATVRTMTQSEFKSTLGSAVNKLNDQMHGIYNEEDKNLFQTYAIGQITMMFRKYLVPAMNRRWKEPYYDFDLMNDTVGFERTAIENARMRLTVIFDRIGGLFDKEFERLRREDRKKSLTPTEKANLRRVHGDLITWAVFSGLLLWIDVLDDDNSDDSWFEKYMTLLLYRAITEHNQFAFTGLIPIVGKDMVKTWWEILDEPVIGMSSTEILISLTDPIGWFTRYQNGPNKGQIRNWVRLQKLVPVWKPMKNVLDPQPKYYRDAGKIELYKDIMD